MKLFLLSLLLAIVTLELQAQQKELDLRSAVLGQWSKFYPTNINNLNWLKDSDAYCYITDDGKQLVKKNLTNEISMLLCDLKTLNAAAGLNLNRFPSVRWESSQSFSFMHSNSRFYMSFQAAKKNPRSLIQIKDAKDLVLVQQLRYPKGQNTDVSEASLQVAYTQNNNLYIQNKSANSVAVTEHKDANITAGQAIARYEFGISKGTFWSPDGQYLAFYEKDETDVADYPLLDITTTPGSLKSIKYPMAGQKSEYAKVGVYDCNKSSLVYLNVKGPKDQYLTNVGWGPDSKYLYVVVVNRDQNHIWLQKYEAVSGKFVATLFEEKHQRYVEPEHPVWFLPNNKNEFLWWSERDGFMHLYRYNVKGQLLGQVTKGNWVCLDILGLDASSKNILVTGTDASGLNTSLYTAPIQGNAPSKRIIKEDGIHQFQLSPSGQYVIDNYSDTKQPRVVRIVDTKGTALLDLHKAKNPLDAYNISSPEIISLKAADGTVLQSRMIKPANFDPSKKYPVLVYVYGGPHAQMVKNSWLANASLWMYYAANQGYLVYTLDNRGSANRGFEFESIIHRNLSKVEMEDQLVGVEYLKSLPYVDADRMAVHGWSYGGFMTSSLMLKYPDVFKVGVAGGPVTDWNYYEIMYGERYMDHPEQNPDGYNITQLKNYVDQLKGDLLLIHGTVDDVVLMQHNYDLVKAFVESGKMVDFFPYPMHKHNVRGKDRVHLMQKVLSYIDDKLSK